MVTVVRPTGFVEPCIPTRACKVPSGPGWVHEINTTATGCRSGATATPYGCSPGADTIGAGVIQPLPALPRCSARRLSPSMGRRAPLFSSRNASPSRGAHLAHAIFHDTPIARRQDSHANDSSVESVAILRDRSIHTT
jgi:hypothetical protein